MDGIAGEALAPCPRGMAGLTGNGYHFGGSSIPVVEALHGDRKAP